jgi:glucose uptake protein GlcU
MDIKELEKRISNIEKRNQKVEQNKKWETSLIRRTLLITFTYLSIAFYMNAIKVNNPWLNAVIPSIGFLLSTLTLPFFKKLWTNKQNKS